MGELQAAATGSGPLLERDYWAVIRDAEVSPRELIDVLTERLPEFAPSELVRFARRGGPGRLALHDELEVRITLAGGCAVRVVHRSPCSFTLGTLEGHPEAGRITFGAYANDRGDLVLHIRSRARSSSGNRYLGFLFAGDPMQTNTWSDLIARVARTVGSGVVGAIHAEKRTVEEEPGDRAMDRPTFLAECD